MGHAGLACLELDARARTQWQVSKLSAVTTAPSSGAEASLVIGEVTVGVVRWCVRWCRAIRCRSFMSLPQTLSPRVGSPLFGSGSETDDGEGGERDEEEGKELGAGPIIDVFVRELEGI